VTRKVEFTKSRSMSKRGIKLLIRQSRKTQFLILENSISYLGKLNFLSWSFGILKLLNLVRVKVIRFVNLKMYQLLLKHNHMNFNNC